MTAPAALDPAVTDALDHLVDGIWDGRVDPTLVERCRQRMCTLLGADPATGRHRHAPTDLGDPDDGGRACLVFAEQWVLDPHGVTDEQAAGVRSHLTDAECASFTIALAVLEAQIRTELALAALR